MILSRRSVLIAGVAAAATLPSSLACAADPTVPIVDRLEGIRSDLGGRVGVHVHDTHTGRRIRFDDDSRYAMASTFKLLLAAAVLSKVERGQLELTQSVKVSQKDMISNAPVTSKHLPKGTITVKELCAAVVEVSDNPAANLLLGLIGGPTGFTKYVRTLGDEVTQLDRTELELNMNLPHDPRDTTTPRMMVANMEQVLLGNALSDASRRMLTGWMVSSPTGLKRIRAGLPEDWKAGDKTGTGSNGAVNDIAILWPPGRKPVLMAVYLSDSPLPTDHLQAAHVAIARAIVAELEV
jgi:beta-lactamase class A